MAAAMSLLPKAKAELERAIRLDSNLIAARFVLLEISSRPAIAGGSESGALDCRSRTAQAVDVLALPFFRHPRPA
jgi:hypothetical protein